MQCREKLRNQISNTASSSELKIVQVASYCWLNTYWWYSYDIIQSCNELQKMFCYGVLLYEAYPQEKDMKTYWWWGKIIWDSLCQYCRSLEPAITKTGCRNMEKIWQGILVIGTYTWNGHWYWWWIYKGINCRVHFIQRHGSSFVTQQLTCNYTVARCGRKHLFNIKMYKRIGETAEVDWKWKYDGENAASRILYCIFKPFYEISR